MAEAIARAHLNGSDPPIFVGSAGIAAADGLGPTQETLAALARLGIEHDGRSKTLTAEMARKADLILCMSPSHLDAVKHMLADDQAGSAKVHLLDSEGNAVPDPIGMGQPAYDALAKRFAEVIPARVESLLAASA
jgi:protein-tyrosine-phosphatase